MCRLIYPGDELIRCADGRSTGGGARPYLSPRSGITCQIPERCRSGVAASCAGSAARALGTNTTRWSPTKVVASIRSIIFTGEGTSRRARPVMGTLMGHRFMVMLTEERLEWAQRSGAAAPIDQVLGLKNNIAFLREMAIGITLMCLLFFDREDRHPAGGRSRRTGNSTVSHCGRNGTDTQKPTSKTSRRGLVHDD